METPEAIFSYSTTTPTVQGRDGRNYAVGAPLVDSTNRPRGGWKVRIPISGHSEIVTGNSPREVHSQVVSLLKTNHLEYSELDVWLNLNIQWLQKAPEHKQKVRLSDLLALASGNPPPPVAHSKRANTPPSVWGSKGWASLQMYLAGDIYQHGAFLRRAMDLAELVNPDINPAIGCADCYRHFSAALEDLRRTPRYTQPEARKWLFETMNSVNKRRIAEGDTRARILTYEQAAQANHWI